MRQEEIWKKRKSREEKQTMGTAQSKYRFPQNEPKWTRKIEECTRIKEMQKEQRLANVRGKKKRCGMKRLSKKSAQD